MSGILLRLNIYMENVQLTIADIASAKSIIEAACTRGAFKGPEMSTVGAIYDKLDAFINQATAQLKTQESEQGETNA